MGLHLEGFADYGTVGCSCLKRGNFVSASSEGEGAGEDF
jgi:hypothetical protein